MLLIGGLVEGIIDGGDEDIGGVVDRSGGDVLSNAGNVDLGTNDGDVDLGTNEGDVDLGTNEGDVDPGTNEGDVDLATNEGDVDLATNDGVVLGADGLILVGYNRTKIIHSKHINACQYSSADQTFYDN